MRPLHEELVEYLKSKITNLNLQPNPSSKPLNVYEINTTVDDCNEPPSPTKTGKRGRPVGGNGDDDQVLENQLKKSNKTEPRIIPPLVADEELLAEGPLKQVGAILKQQGWGSSSLLGGKVRVSETLIGEFYRSFRLIVRESDTMVAIYRIGGDVYRFTSLDVARHMGVIRSRDGYSKYLTTTRRWPGKAEMGEIIENVTGKADCYALVVGVDTDRFRSLAKILHHIVISNVVPRAEDREIASMLDMMLIHLMLRGDRIDLPVLVMKHMEYSSKMGRGLPYPVLVKKLLVEKGVYNADGEKEYGIEFNELTLREMDLVGTTPLSSVWTEFCVVLDEVSVLLKEAIRITAPPKSTE